MVEQGLWRGKAWEREWEEWNRTRWKKEVGNEEGELEAIREQKPRKKEVGIRGVEKFHKEYVSRRWRNRIGNGS